MKLYVIPGACSLAAHIALREAVLPFELLIVDASTKQVDDGTKFGAINSKGYVPALKLDDGQVLTENVAVLQYIADRNPAAKLAPTAGTMQRYRLQEWLSFINSEVHKGFSPFFSAVAAAEVKHYARDLLTKRFIWLEGVIGSGDFLMGNTFTVADAYLFTVLGWCGEIDLDIGRWPTLKRYHVHIGSRPHVLAALKAEGLTE